MGQQLPSKREMHRNTNQSFFYQKFGYAKAGIQKKNRQSIHEHHELAFDILNSSQAGQMQG